jgi:hypothetical protein
MNHTERKALMPPSEQSVTPFTTPEHPSILHVTLATARPNMSGPFTSRDQPIGVAAWVSKAGAIEEEPHWMAGYAKSDDMGRAAMVHHLLQLPGYSGAVLEVSSVGLGDILSHVPGARQRNGLRTSGKPFEAFDVFDPVEAALNREEWRLRASDHGPAYVNRGGVDVLARVALEIALGLTHEFAQHKEAHPYWWMLQIGRTANTHGENYEPR